MILIVVILFLIKTISHSSIPNFSEYFDALSAIERNEEALRVIEKEWRDLGDLDEVLLTYVAKHLSEMPDPEEGSDEAFEAWRAAAEQEELDDDMTDEEFARMVAEDFDEE